MFKLTLLFLVSMIFISCAKVVTKESCSNINWETLGEKDGSHGQTNHNANSIVNECQRLGVIANISSYNLGAVRGLDYYCSKKSAYSLGRENSEYKYTVCSHQKQALLFKEYVKGLNETEIELKKNITDETIVLNRLKEQVEKVNKELEKLEKLKKGLRTNNDDQKILRRLREIENLNTQNNTAIRDKVNDIRNIIEKSPFYWNRL